jgi:hypothetical protein
MRREIKLCIANPNIRGLDVESMCLKTHAFGKIAAYNALSNSIPSCSRPQDSCYVT